MKEKKLLRALGNVDNQYIKEAEPMKKTSKITNRQKWVSVAACFVLVAVIGVGVFQSNLFGTKNDIATLNDGETITFVKNDLSQSSINLNVRERRYLCMKEKKLLRALGNVDNQYIKEAEPMKKTSKITNRQKWVSVAACFVLVAVIGVGVFQSNLFGTKNDIATLNDGETITFVKNDLSQSSINLNVTTRPLSDAEIEMLFADLPVTADAYFDADNHNILGFEGKIDDTRMVVSKQGVNLLDTIIDGNTITSSVDGVDINAGYFVTKSNSQGVKTVIYYATFDMGENTIYVEYSGVENESETVKNNLADTILKLIENGAFDLSQIQE